MSTMKESQRLLISEEVPTVTRILIENRLISGDRYCRGPVSKPHQSPSVSSPPVSMEHLVFPLMMSLAPADARPGACDAPGGLY